MPHEIVGKLRTEPGDRYGIVVSRYHEQVTQRLLDGAVETLARHGLDPAAITVAWVPGSFELPVVADRMAKQGQFAAVIALGAVVQGETEHHDYINHAVAQGFAVTSQNTGVPVLFGVLTCRNMDQALARAGGAVGNKGAEAALAAIETVSVLKQLGQNARMP
ncbi:6,7-dimethyl-8-ribityllumazine synthase [Planctomicrobium piriforme]|uniref:6,7-dimethyl-8-ribityllumazine synthase n=1 Tax=Planctomicrobium piriforme TaxID=1576369 RepID=A0A1I3HYH2_9PLAN|nr:6,7-dimethyl-8-ribityllumazine synthase [Planctomicrobium piriforme]SFI40639.1 6,7-dimethyl-8-ribityllumazine synthase [Planctomicrobium piriforme]